MTVTERSGAGRREPGLASRIVALVLLVSVPLAALSIASAISNRGDDADEAHSRTGEIAAVGAVSITGVVDQAVLLLDTIGRLSDPSGASCQAELQVGLLPTETYQDVYSVDDDGSVVCTSAVQDPGVSVAATEWFRRTEARAAPTVTAPAMPVAGTGTTMIVARPRPTPVDPDGAPAPDPSAPGLLAVTLPPQQLVDFATTVDLPPDSVIQVVDEEGLVLARTSDHDEYDLAPVQDFDQIDGRAAGTIDGPGVDGIDRLNSFERVEVGGETLYVMAGLSRSEALSRANQRLAWSLAIIAVLGVAVAGLTLAAGRSLLSQPVERLRTAMADFRAGDRTRRAGAIGGPKEVVELARSFDGMADEIQIRLENQERLLEQLEEAAEAERQTIAAGIHDETLQTLSALGIRLQLLRRTVDGTRRAELDQSLEMLNETAAQLRGLLFDLRPPAFERIGLAATLRETLEVRFSADLDGWSVVGEPGPDVPDHAQILMYRVAQQALANIREHARAHRVDITITSEDSVLTMEVVDDGTGFEAERVEADPRPGHIGLRVMADRARSAGGEVTITSTPGHGTTVRVEIPFRRLADSEDADQGEGGPPADA